MGSHARAGTHEPTAWLLLLLLAVPLLTIVWIAMDAAWNAQAWRALLSDPTTSHAFALSLWTGGLSTMLAIWIARLFLCHHFPGKTWAGLVRALSPLLAMPHAAFAIGLFFLISPSGWLLRVFSPWATGLEAPPPWPITQDPWGLGLIAVLVAKEVPFLLWAAATQLQRPDVAQRHVRELQIAHSLGYSPQQAWQLVLWPQLWPRLRWPLMAVLVYNLTVVDVALVIGPASPPTLSVLAWQWLQDAEPIRNAQGAIAGWLLAATAIGLATLASLIARLARWRAYWTQGQRGQPSASNLPARLLVLPYLAVMLALAVGSVAGTWSFPVLLPDTLTLQAWESVAASASTLGSTVSLGLACALTALCWVVAWLEWAPAPWQMPMQRLIFVPLLMPPVLWVVGMHGLALRIWLDTSWAGVALAHTLTAVPYVMIAVGPAYLGFDSRLSQVAASLGHGRVVFLWRVKWPLLRAALASGLAIGFAVSVAQYLSTQFIGGGRISTVTTEAITLAAGAQRSLTAAYAWLQWGLPVLGFAAAAWFGRPWNAGKR